MVLKNKNRILEAYAITILIIVAFIILTPLFRSGFPVTDDGGWMIIRLSAFYQSLSEGQFPVRFLGRLNNGYGYPVANFLYPGFLYVGSIFHAFGLGYISSVKLIIVLSLSLGSIFLFKLLRTSYTLGPSLMGTLSFLFSPYLLFDIYKRGSVGEILAFLPAFVCFYSINTHRKNLFALAIALLLISHNILALMFLGLIVMYIFMVRKIYLLSYLVLGIGIASFFWLPALYELRYVAFSNVILSEPSQHIVTAIPWNSAGMVTYLVVMGLLFGKRTLSVSEVFFLIVFILCLVFASSVALFVWSGEILLKFIQFPYRFLALVIFASSHLVAAFFQKYNMRWYFLLIFLIAWLGTLSPTFSSIRYENHLDSYYATNEATTTIEDEYMPQWVSEKPDKHAQEKMLISKGSGTIYPKIINGSTFEFDVELSQDSELQVNTLYYPGWGVLVDNNFVQINYDNPSGVIKFTVPKGSHSIFGEFRETGIRLFADFVSILCIVICGWLVLQSYYLKKNNIQGRL